MADTEPCDDAAFYAGVLDASAHAELGQLEILETVAGALWRFGGPSPELVRSPTGRPAPTLVVAEEPEYVLGRLRETLLSDEDKRRGTIYTSPQIADSIVEEAFVCFETAADAGNHRLDWSAINVFDPALGAGVFLIAAGKALERRGVERSEALAQLWGVDLDPIAVKVSEASLALWAGGRLPPQDRLVCGDALDGAGDELGERHSCDFDIVVGNPPFQSQLARSTARSSQNVEQLRERHGEVVYRFADTAALFLAAAWSLVAPGGVVSLILPQSFLAAADTRPVRDRCVSEGRLVSMWVDGEDVFAAKVNVCAPVLAKVSQSSDIRRHGTAAFERADDLASNRLEDASSWAPLVSDLLGSPPVQLDDAAGRLGDLCEATAGFRDQYYGLRGAVVESDAPEDEIRPLLITSGLIDPARCRWGVETARFDRQKWQAPVIDTEVLAQRQPAVARWGEAVTRPKLVVATQTRVLEAVADCDGRFWPSVPTIAVFAPVLDLHLVLAAVLAPPVTAWAFERSAGAALARDAIKLAARQVLEIPLPSDELAWRQGAHLLCEKVEPAALLEDKERWLTGLGEFGDCMCQAYRVDESVAAWWFDRLPRRR